MKIRTIEEINNKIKDGEATVLTAEEVSKLVREGNKPKAEDVDVITTGTCGIMSGTAAIFHVPVAEPGAFKKAKSVLLNGVPGFPGPCPNEWLGSVDMIVYGTSHSIHGNRYGGGFLFKDIVSGKDIEVEVESTNGEKIKSTVNIEDIGTAQMIGTRLAFKNYNSFVNPTDKPVSSIFNAIDLEGPFKGFTFSGCGELNPLQNDPIMKTICAGSKVLLNGAEGYVIGRGTRSSDEKPNMMITADMKDMDTHYLGGFKTGAGPEVFDSVAAAIPVLDDEILKETFIQNKDIKLPVTDIRGRHNVLGFTDYDDVWGGADERPVYHPERCLNCDVCIVRERCPTGAYSDTLNTRRCFGCGMCAYSCPNAAFTMESGSVQFEIKDRSIELPIVCRQSDIKRARELVAELTKRIENGEFILNEC
ncbi:methanogenesis marker 16 metalloprotein [Methanobacterium paludis]|uniref:Methanogenesis marker 16 metalloprotein n=1 Tax=Methanobacterium paludis (strain DSM 25820 / JCM 18151 / SWAN1) TaxID=868131 RepID=F6D3L3_METPW|nr:methanogenesis marker 16 metalloprotein [Methanobacterium paludis]AEG17430.1 methanogenesis marker 16 metalloprotein [Methanobacterium paludis]